MQQAPEEYQLNYIEAVAGLFHLQMSVLTLLFRTHFGADHDISSLRQWMKWLKRDSNIYSVKKGSIKNFRACHQFFNHVLDAHILAAVAAELRVDNCSDLCSKLESENWREAVKRVTEKYSGLTLVSGWREEGKKPDGKRDIVRENAVLFLQHGLMYRDFCDSMRCGDTGRVKHCLSFFMTWFQGSTLKNYAAETLHMVACLDCLWSPKLRLFWLDNCLVNFSGSPKGFMACDLLGELIIRELKDLISHLNSQASDDYFRNVLSPQVMTIREIRNNMLRITNATNYYQHSSTGNPWNDVRVVTEKLLSAGIFDFVPGRTHINHTGEDDIKAYTEAADLHVVGVEKIWNGKSIDRYKDKIRKGLPYFEEDNELEIENGLEVSESGEPILEDELM